MPKRLDINYNRNKLKIDGTNFLFSEFGCKGIKKKFDCCYGVVMVNPLTVQALQRVRNFINKPLIINSGFRCEKYNNHIGGSSRSRHPKGLAVDVSIKGTDLSVRELADLLSQFGMARVGLYLSLGFVHAEPFDRYISDQELLKEWIIP